MPFRKTYRRRFNRKYGKYVSRSVKAYVAKAIRQNVENKNVINYPATTFIGIANTWTELDISTCASGYGLTGRVGRELKIKSLQAKFVLDIGDATNVIRCVIALIDGTQTTPFATAGVTIDSMLRPVACRNFLKKKFYDNYIVLDEHKPQHVVDYFKKFKKPITIRYGDDTANYPSLRIMIAMISDSGAVTHPQCTNGYIVASFEDA